MIGWLTLPRALSVCDIPSKIDLLNLILHPTVLGIIKPQFLVYLERHFSLKQDAREQSEPDDKMKCFTETKTVKARMKLIAASLSPCLQWYCLTVTWPETKMFHLYELDLVFRCRDHLPPPVIVTG